MRRSSNPGLLILALILVCAPAEAEPEFKWIYDFDGGDTRTDVGEFALTDGDSHLILGGRATPLGEQINSVVSKFDRLTGEPVWTTWYGSGAENEIALHGVIWDGYGDLLVGEYIQACVG
jgi:hypothetical protein